MKNQQTEKYFTPPERLEQLRYNFVGQVLGCFLVLSIVGVPLSISRSLISGWQFLYTIHIILAIIIFGIYLFRNRIPLFTKSVFIVITCWILATGSLFSFGLVGNGISIFFFMHFFVAAIYSLRTSIIMSIATILFLVAFGIGYTNDILRISIDSNDYVGQITSWAVVWVWTGATLFVAYSAMSVLQQSTRELFQKIQDQQEQIIFLSDHDQLTGLPLMRLAQDRLEVAFQHAKRYQKKVALLFIDLDGFKMVNDTYGHDVGDYVLQEVAKRMRQVTRAEDTVSRIGGDEFLANLGDLTQKHAAGEVAKKIILAISQRIDFKGFSFSVGASIGIAIFPDDANEVDTLRRLADEAMYNVKKAEKNNFAFAM